jgi:polyisoprenoid-binding protein YceI
MSSRRLDVSTGGRRAVRLGRRPRIPGMKRLIPLLTAVLLAGCSTVGTEATSSETPGPDPTTTSPSTTAAPDASMNSMALAPGSEVRFYIFELFRGEPLVVEAINDDVTGSITIDGDTAIPGTFVIEADGFVTERGEAPSPLGEEVGWRDEAIDRFILDVADHPEILFEPDAVPLTTDTTELGGTLTVRDVSQPVTFSVEISETDDGYAVTGVADVLRTDFGLRIPTVAHVAEVADEVQLQLEFYFAPAA